MSTKQQQHAKVWEGYIKKECRALKDAGLAFVEKNHEAPTIPGEDIPRAPSKPDFSGWLLGGRHVVFEAKATLSETSFSYHQIADHQWEHLDLADKAGAVAFVYVLDGRRRKWVLPWSHVLEWKDVRASFPFNENPESRECQKHDGETWLDTLDRLEVIDG